MNTQVPVTLYLESNPNPNSLKFVANYMIVPTGKSFDFPSPGAAQSSPLAQELFMYPFVQRVFFMSNFVTVTKNEDVEWASIQDTLKNHIKKFLESGQSVVELSQEEISESEEDTESSATIKKIKSILDEYIRPAVEQDGGAIAFHSFQKKTVTVVLQGSCSGCPSSTITLKAGIENLFTKMMPNEVETVEAIPE